MMPRGFSLFSVSLGKITPGTNLDLETAYVLPRIARRRIERMAFLIGFEIAL